MTHKTHTVDARQLLCPMPVIRVQEAIEHLSSGDYITALCTDPGVMHDIPAWSRVHGHEIIDTQENEHEYHITIRVIK